MKLKLNMPKIFTQLFKQYVTKYTTTSTVAVQNPTVAILYFTLVTTAFCMYFASIDFNLRRLYQKECPVHGVTLSQVEGQANTKNKSGSDKIPDHYKKVWDAEELVYPQHGGEGDTGSFAIVTNMGITENQTRGRCEPGDDTRSCKDDADCQEGILDYYGVLTGRCLQDKRVCEVEGWCPSGLDFFLTYAETWKKKVMLEDVKSFIVLLKNFVDFPGCGQHHTNNIQLSAGLQYILLCTYDPVQHPHCPRFRIEDLVELSGISFEQASRRGSVFRIRIKWDCDFDFGWTSKDCLPTYEFSTVFDDENFLIKHFFFESSIYHQHGTRTERKMFALKFLISIEGKGRKFHFFTFIINLGASTGLLGVAPFICDFILSFFEKCGGSKSGTDKGKSLPVDVAHLATTIFPTTVVPINQEINK